MKKIALIGVENTHAPAFVKLMKEKPEKYQDMEIIGVYSYDGNASAKMVEEGLAPMAVSDPNYFLDKADAVINTARHGDCHYEYSMPYIKAGIPMFIDKPFAIYPSQAKMMIDAAKEAGTPLCGGSSMKFAKDILAIKKAIADGEYGRILSSSLSAPVKMASAFGGFYFYSAHLTEMMLTLYGMPEAVCAVERAESVTAICKYATFDVTLHFLGRNYYSASIYGNEKCAHTQINAGGAYEAELDEFCAMVRGEKIETTYEDLLAPVLVMHALYVSYASGGTWQKL